MQLRPYQQDFLNKIKKSFNHNQNTIGVLPTGAGKTVIFSTLLQEIAGYTCVIAHRQELVSQISKSLARAGKYHAIIAPEPVIKNCVKQQMIEFGTSFYDPDSNCHVAGIDTIIRRTYPFYKKVELFVIDECHHVVRGNKWHVGTELFSNAQGLGVTATPCRADGKGLGRHASGIFDVMIEGVRMRELINSGFLSDYRVYASASDLDYETLKVGKSGDYSLPSLVKAMEKSKITGDIVDHYLKFAEGLQGIVFAVNVDHAKVIADEFYKKGILAKSVSGKTPESERQDIIEAFKAQEIKILTNCALFDEGFDTPSVSYVGMCRPTKSFSRFSQSFGRALRPSPGKKEAIIIDHVGNCIQHGMPDQRNFWSLADRTRKKDEKINVLTTCFKCTGVYKRIFKECPYCGYVREIKENATIDEVAGELEEISSSIKDKIWLEIKKIRLHPEELRKKIRSQGKSQVIEFSVIKNHVKRQKAIDKLHAEIMLFCNGQDERPFMQRLFYLTFGIDILTAHTLSTKDANELAWRINENRSRNNDGVES